MKLVLLTGMSGAGRSVALKTLEDHGYEAIDNLPLAFLQTVAKAEGERNLAIGMDVRGRDFSAATLLKTIAPLKADPGIDFQLVFLDCDDEVLRRRFSETRRLHPLALDRTILDGIHQERRLIGDLRDSADLVIDTSETSVTHLRRTVTAHFADEEGSLSIALTSFSIKRGLPRDADIVFDVRFLKNPHYVPELKALSGLDAHVGAYIEKDKDFSGFYQRLTALLLPLLPRYVDEGKRYLTIAIGCTGGRHRSVFIVQKLGAFLSAEGYNVSIRHRDVEHI